MNLSKYELCIWDNSQALGRQGLSHRCRCDGTTGQVSVLHITKGTGAYTPLFSLSYLLIISVETGKELKVKTELVILHVNNSRLLIWAVQRKIQTAPRISPECLPQSYNFCSLPLGRRALGLLGFGSSHTFCWEKEEDAFFPDL